MELDVEVLVVDDLVSGLVLGVGVDVGGGTTCSLTRRVVDVSVDGGVCDADVQDRLGLHNNTNPLRVHTHKPSKFCHPTHRT